MRKPGSFLIMFGSILTFFGLIFAAPGASILIPEIRFLTEGQKATATVVSKELKTGSDSNSGTSYILNYSLPAANSAEIQGSGTISKEKWDSVKEGEPVEVLYIPGGSGQTRLSSSGISENLIMGAVFGGIGLLFVLGGTACLTHGIKKRLRYSRLIKTGTLADAKVVESSPSSLSINNVQQWTITYSYTDHMGKTHRSVSHYLSPGEARQWNSGDTGKIRFDRSSPKDSIWVGRSAAETPGMRR